MLRLSVTAALLTLPIAADVIPVPVGSLLYDQAHYFDLAGRRIRFVPAGANTYKLQSKIGAAMDTRGQKPVKPGPISLPFAFPFGGRTWDKVYINVNGNLTFGGAEKAHTDDPPETWPSATLQWFASFVDTRSIKGGLLMIAPSWGWDSPADTLITASATPRELVVTWDAIRFTRLNEDYPPLGRNLFQARLSRDGAIEFRYGSVAEKDGVAGIFPGAAASTQIDTSKLASARVDVEDAGTNVRLTIHTGAPLPEKLTGGKQIYRILVASGDAMYRLSLSIDEKGRNDEVMCLRVNAEHAGSIDGCLAAPVLITRGADIIGLIPKSGLREPGVLHWQAQSIREGDPSATITTADDYREARFSAPVLRFSAPPAKASGAIFEVFHYPEVPKAPSRTLPEIYKIHPADEDFALLFTDFRIDDVHNGAGSVGDEAVGNDFTRHPDLQFTNFGSRNLQQAVATMYLASRCAESPPDPERVWRNYAFCVGHMAHEITHRWVAAARWKGPVSDPLFGSDWHWSMFLDTPVVRPVWQLFTDKRYPEESNMGGMLIHMKPDGTGDSEMAPWQAPKGLSALDLYLMGMIEANEVPDMTLIHGVKRTESGGYDGADAKPVTVKLADIIAAGGPRKPAAKDAQHDFTIRIYLLHEDGRPPDPAKLKIAQGIEAMLVRYFDVATGGKMKLIPR
jgi:hypothetical protein